MMNMKTIALAATLTALVAAPAQAQDPELIGEGARVYSDTCGRCHNPRGSSERTDADWATIMAHMRARANITKGASEAVLAYLQATNMPENMAPVPVPVPEPADASSRKPAPEKEPTKKEGAGGS